MQLKNLGEILCIIIFMLIIFVENVPAKKKPPFIDPKITSGEKSTYEVIEDGKVYSENYTILRQNNSGKEVYIVCAQGYQMKLEASTLRPIYIEKTDDNGSLKFSIEYSEDRVHFVYPGPKRNVVEKVPEDRYDVHTVLQSVRGFPLGQKEAKFTLVTPEHPGGVGFYIKIVCSERVTTPAGCFDCYQLEAGVDGLLGKVVKKKFFFWLEKRPPYRLIKHTDSDGERILTLVAYEIPKND
ncbi:hypothetical protein H8E77_05635 [bacterium]|nr:hypothetical protein [bacterium]